MNISLSARHDAAAHSPPKETGIERADAPALPESRARISVAYVINQYPQSSHSFIRREIAALENAGVRVERFTIRKWPTALVDSADRDEQIRTHVILNEGIGRILFAVVQTLFTRPVCFVRALALAWKTGYRSDRGMGRHLAYFIEACVLRRWLADRKIAHLHAHFGTNSTSVAMLCRELGGPPYSFTAHGPEEFDKPEAIHLSDKIRRAKFVVAISDFGRSQLFRWCDSSHWPKIHIVRCGVDSLFLQSPPTPPTELPRLVCVGRLCEQKGQLLLIQAAAQLASQGIDFTLTLVGDGPMRAEIQALIARHNLSDRVTITGWMSNPQVRQQILSARALVLPSFAEGLPVVIMEALALHRPVVSTYVAGIPELVRPGESGWLVPPGDIDGLVAALKQVLAASPQDLERIGAAGAKAVALHHSASSEAQKLAQLFFEASSK